MARTVAASDGAAATAAARGWLGGERRRALGEAEGDQEAAAGGAQARGRRLDRVRHGRQLRCRGEALGEADDRIAARVAAGEQAGKEEQEGHDRQQKGAKLGHRRQDNVRAMRPGRESIAAPDLPAGLEWVGEAPASMPVATAAGPVLVHFLDFAQLNSVRTLPYLVEWERRYRDAGLRVLGVQAPRFAFGADCDAVEAGLRRLGVGFPVAIDAERALWHAYGCEGWPSLFLWALGGALSWFHFGEGEYLATEEAIQAELRELDALRRLPTPMAPLRATDAPGTRVMPPSEEVFPGGSWERPWAAGEDGEELAIAYTAGGAYATVEGSGEVAVELDGSAIEPIEIDGPGLHALSEHPRHEAHTLMLRPSPGLRIWSVSFAAGEP
jgi:hypothetical protein